MLKKRAILKKVRYKGYVYKNEELVGCYVNLDGVATFSDG